MSGPNPILDYWRERALAAEAQRDTLAAAADALIAVLDGEDDPRWDGENEYARLHEALAAARGDA